MATLSADQLIDSYRIVRQIGEGGMGAVYEAVHVVLGQRVAIKVLTVDFRANPALLQRFVNEARAASQINHPGIVKVHDLGHMSDGSPWLSMEYLEGESLSSRMQAAMRRPGRCLGIDDLWIIGDLASALAAAHAKGIIHRDLKPANVMIVSDPSTLSGERAKVLDFGVAKLHSDSLTKSGAILGTPLYMALEQFKDSAEVDGRADVFSLGCICYQALTGRLPHNGQTHYELMGARLMKAIPPVQRLVPSLPPAVSTLVMRMLEIQPEQRPTMLEVETEVRRALGLPLPRQSGWHSAVSASSAESAGAAPAEELRDELEPPIAAADPPQIDSNAATPDVLPDAVPPILPATPSDQRVVGEISPPSAVPVPVSLSSVPSVPVVVGNQPVVRATPEGSTINPAPTPFVPEVVASPSSPTVPPPKRRKRSYWPAAAVSVVLFGIAGVALWPQNKPPPAVSPPGAPLQPATGAPVEVPPPPPKAADPTPIKADPAGAAPAVEPAPPEQEAGASAQAAEHAPLAAHKAPAISRSPVHACEPREFTPDCSITPEIPAEQRKLLIAAVRQSGSRFCPGEALVLAGLPDSPSILAAPASLRHELQPVLILVLRGTLRGKPFPAKLKLQCKPH